MKKIIVFCLSFIILGIINVNAGTIYKVQYVLFDGTNNSENITQYEELNENFILLNPTKKGYTFDGWYRDSAYTKRSTKIPAGSTGNKKFYAKWIENTYAIKYRDNGATSGSMINQKGLLYSNEYQLNAIGFEKTGYHFVEWNTKVDGTGKRYNDKATVSKLTSANNRTVNLYAQWEINTYTITYNLNGGKNNKENPKEYNVESEFKLKNPTKTGYKFDGWYTDAKFTEKNSYIIKGTTGNITLYAKWVIKDYSITYNLLGGRNLSTNPLTYNIESELTIRNASRKGYSFGGWFPDMTWKGKVRDILKGTTGNMTLYARWVLPKPSYTIQNSISGEVKISSSKMIELYRSIDGKKYELIGSGTSIVDNNVVPGGKYYYKIRSYEYDSEYDYTIYSSYVSFEYTVREWFWPTKTSYSISSPYGYRSGRLHSGVDLYVGGRGVPIYAARDGIITEITSNSSSGFYVIIKHDNGYYTRYAHMQNTGGNDNLTGISSATKYIEVGQRVSAREQIGEVGSSGNSTGPHLHFEIWDGVPFQAESYDPMLFY